MTVSIASCALWAAAAPTIAGGGEASKSPNTILSDMKRDLVKVKSVHFAGSMTDPSGVTRMSGDVFASGSASFGVTQGKITFRMIMLPKSTYLRGNAGYWRTAPGAEDDPELVARLTGRWVKVPTSVRDSIRSLMSTVSLKNLARCLAGRTGTLTNNGLTTFGGRRAIIVEAKDDRPGATPGLLYVTADGPVLPVRDVQTGPRKAGGKLDRRCDTPDNKITASDITYGQYNRVPPLRAPRGALSVG